MASAASERLRIGIVGAGFISDYHVNGLRAAGATAVNVLVGRSPERTAVRAKALGIAQSATDYAGVLADPAVDAVVIATPDDMHKAMAIAALRAGKAVLLQKPMAMTSAECAEILKVAEHATAPLTVSFMHRHFPEVRWLRQLLATGDLGKIHTIRIRNATPGADWAEWFFSPENVSGGVVMQLGVHGIDLIQMLFGRIEDVAAGLATQQPVRTLNDGRKITSTLEDNVLARYRLASGALVTHEMSYTEVAGCDRFRLEVYAERGTVWLRTERGTAAIYAPDVTGQDDWVVPEFEDEPLGQDHHAAWMGIAAGLSPADDTGMAGLSSVLVAEAIYEAARQGTVVSVPTATEYLERT